MARKKKKSTTDLIGTAAPIVARKGFEATKANLEKGPPWTPEERKAVVDAIRSVAEFHVKGSAVKDILWIVVRLSVTGGLIWATYELVQADKFSSPVALFFGTLMGYMFGKEKAD